MTEEVTVKTGARVCEGSWPPFLLAAALELAWLAALAWLALR